ncbi:MAG TPA: DUF1194 domain-containing protein [Alphaproteobacteria bacterium]
MRLASLLCVLGLAAALAGPTARADEPVDLQLVLAVDSSSSVSMDEYYLQLQGYAAAFRHPELLKAIRSGSHQAIAVMLFEWSSERQQTVNFEWRRLADDASLEKLASELENAPRLVIGGETAIGEAIEFGMRQFADCAFDGTRRVIDISGDGSSNRGRRVTMARDDAVLQGITINGLAVLHEEPQLDAYYQRYVVGGVGAFVISAHDYTDFADAILKKLLHEVQTVAELPGRPS